MNYQDYLNKFRAAQLEERIPKTEQPWSEESFEFFTTPLKKTVELKDDVPFRLSYKRLYFSLKKLLERAGNKEGLQELEKSYYEVAEKLNLL